jgi:hypothetical protein
VFLSTPIDTTTSKTVSLRFSSKDKTNKNKEYKLVFKFVNQYLKCLINLINDLTRTEFSSSVSEVESLTLSEFSLLFAKKSF